MELIGIDTEDNRVRIHIRARSADDNEVVAYGLRRHLDRLPSDAESRISQALSNHDIERYPEAAYIGVFASFELEHGDIRDQDEILTDPYPRDIDLAEFPPAEGQRYKW
jgi:hypothetical protein